LKNKINKEFCFFFDLPQGPSFLSEAIFPKSATKIEEMDPFFNLHETIAKVGKEYICELMNRMGKVIL
jgi:hypothetical protein